MTQFSIRLATQDDIPAISKLHIVGWHGAYGGMVDQSYLDGLRIEDKIKSWGEIFSKNETQTLIAETDDNKAIGFVNFGKLMTAPPGTSSIRPLYSSEILALYLLPVYFRQGIGTALMEKAVKELRGNKHRSTCLWVLEKNERAKKFYESLGGQRIGKQMIEIGPSRVKEICFGWRDISVISPSS